MLYDTLDFECLRLVGLCRILPYNLCRKYHEPSLSNKISQVQGRLCIRMRFCKWKIRKHCCWFGRKNRLNVKKIIPDEIAGYDQLEPTRITDYIPEWRQKEMEDKKKEYAVPVSESTLPEPEETEQNMNDIPIPQNLFDTEQIGFVEKEVELTKTERKPITADYLIK